MSSEWRPECMESPSTFVPEQLRGGLSRYVEQGIRPGSGLESVISDARLSVIIGRVDRDVECALGGIFRFLYNCVPGSCWGTPESVTTWIAGGGLAGGME